MNDADAVERHLRRVILAMVLGLALAFGSAVVLAPWKAQDDDKAALLLVYGLLMAALSLSLLAIGRMSAALHAPRRWVRPFGTILLVLGIATTLIAITNLILG